MTLLTAKQIRELLDKKGKDKFLVRQYQQHHGPTYLVKRSDPNEVVARVTRRIFATYDLDFWDEPYLNVQHFEFK